MPNGADRNFVRFLRCIAGFKMLFGKWPTKILLDPDVINEIKKVMDAHDFAKIQENIELVQDDGSIGDYPYIAEDDDGNSYDLHGAQPTETANLKFGEEVVSNNGVMQWLDIEYPDY